MDEEILRLAMLLGNVAEDQREPLERLCRGARLELESRLRRGVSPQDCSDALCLAAAWLALADLDACQAAGGVRSFSAGSLTIQTGEGGGQDTLRRRALGLMAPYLADEGFGFRGVRGG